MDIKKLKQFIQLAKKEGVTSLKYKNDNEAYSVSFENHSVKAMGSFTPQVQSYPSTSARHSHTGADENYAKEQVNENEHIIKAPFVGTFYASSSPGEESFVKVGSKVTAGSTLCILEAMKIMNEIESDVSGEVIEVCVENESYVEYGQALFRIRK